MELKLSVLGILSICILDFPSDSSLNNLTAMLELQEMKVRSLGQEDPL